MTNFEDLSKKPSRFLSFTGLTLEEFLALLPYFALKFQEYMEKFTFEGKIRKNRKYTEYKNACLPTIENKLLFILTYLKGNDLQERIAEMFGISQPKANLWIHLLHRVLNQTLEEIEVLPARDADSLRKQLDKLIEETVTEDITSEVEANEMEAEALEATAEIEVKMEAEAPESAEIETKMEAEALETTAEIETKMEAETLETIVEMESKMEAEALETTAEIEVKMEAETLETTAEIEVKMEAQVPETSAEVEAEMEAEALETIVEMESKIEAEALETTAEIETIEAENMEIIQLFLHDGTERPINRPLNNEIQKIFYSGKQKRHTVKNILLSDVSGYVHFLSYTCEGKKNDKKIADETGYSLPEGSYLGQDTGFQGFEIIGVNIVQPKKKPRGGELTKEEKERNRTISKVRVRVEHSIGGVKRYRIVKDKLRNWKHGFRDLVMETCCGLHNFRLGFRPWNYKIAII